MDCRIEPGNDELHYAQVGLQFCKEGVNRPR